MWNYPTTHTAAHTLTHIIKACMLYELCSVYIGNFILSNEIDCIRSVFLTMRRQAMTKKMTVAEIEIYYHTHTSAVFVCVEVSVNFNRPDFLPISLSTSATSPMNAVRNDMAVHVNYLFVCVTYISSATLTKYQWAARMRQSKSSCNRTHTNTCIYSQNEFIRMWNASQIWLHQISSYL